MALGPMKKTNLLMMLSIFVLSGTGGALAAIKTPSFGWWDGHSKWTQYKKFNPYLEEGQKTQNTQWDEQDWYVQDWISQNKDGFTLINDWFRAGILNKLDTRGDVPLLVVGPNFYRLGGFDKRRVLTTLDVVYGITEHESHNLILLHDWRTKRQIGVFTKEGLQLE
jgi:hypothetical protein